MNATYLIIESLGSLVLLKSSELALKQAVRENPQAVEASLHDLHTMCNNRLSLTDLKGMLERKLNCDSFEAGLCTHLYVLFKREGFEPLSDGENSFAEWAARNLFRIRSKLLLGK